jgi:hypothetical protein
LCYDCHQRNVLSVEVHVHFTDFVEDKDDDFFCFVENIDDDCEVGKSGKKACKNCTCGRAEMESSVTISLTDEQIDNFKSACGNVSLLSYFFNG